MGSYCRFRSSIGTAFAVLLAEGANSGWSGTDHGNSRFISPIFSGQACQIVTGDIRVLRSFGTERLKRSENRYIVVTLRDLAAPGLP